MHDNGNNGNCTSDICDTKYLNGNSGSNHTGSHGLQTSTYMQSSDIRSKSAQKSQSVNVVCGSTTIPSTCDFGYGSNNTRVNDFTPYSLSRATPHGGKGSQHHVKQKQIAAQYHAVRTTNQCNKNQIRYVCN